MIKSECGQGLPALVLPDCLPFFGAGTGSPASLLCSGPTTRVRRSPTPHPVQTLALLPPDPWLAWLEPWDHQRGREPGPSQALGLGLVPRVPPSPTSVSSSWGTFCGAAGADGALCPPAWLLLSLLSSLGELRCMTAGGALVGGVGQDSTGCRVPCLAPGGGQAARPPLRQPAVARTGGTKQEEEGQGEQPGPVPGD